ncbi:oxidoreductase, 2OG-Fe(II) oxygenase family protein [Ostertagia ostertagi]
MTTFLEILSYRDAGHFAPHYDYVELEARPDQGDPTGRRFATFLLLLQGAQSGGGTVFPRLKTTVTPTPGDVIFWINVNVDETEARGSLHGGCPVYRGEKVAAVKWILVDEQDIFQSPHEDGTFDIEKLIYPHTYYYDTTPMYGKCVAKKEASLTFSHRAGTNV